MIASLYISNYVLIDKEELSFSDGFTVITGETGSGKSILINALNLISGARNKGNVAKDNSKKTIFEAVFTKHNIPQAYFEENNIDFDETVIIRREILPGGRSRFFVNDTPANVSIVKEITSKLIDIHSQHQNLLINDPEFQISIIDTYAGNEVILKKYSGLYLQYNKLNSELKHLTEQQKNEIKEKDYIEYRLNLLNNAKLNVKEYYELENKINELSNFEEIKNVLSSISYNFYDVEPAILSQINEAINNLEKITEFLPQAEEWKNRLSSAEVELNDLITEISNKNDNLEFDPEEFNELTTRYNLINDLMQKFAVQSVEELIEEQTKLQEKLDSIVNYDTKIEAIRKELSNVKNELEKLADELSRKRNSVKEKAEKEIEKIIKQLGINNGKVKIDITAQESLTPTGKDKVTLLFSANKNNEPAPVSQIASGGEISRLMLAIKSILAGKKGTQTIIFDEIDTGISGKTAYKMATILKQMSRKQQIIAITHLPQIAAKGDLHLVVVKSDTDNDTITKVVEVKGDDRIKEIAKMISGNKISKVAMENAKQLMEA